jgi:LmeA-like phospholipid-binding
MLNAKNHKRQMFGSFSGTSPSSGSDWGEQMLGTVASKSIALLFSESESVDVQIRCSPPSKLLQGTVDSVKMEGRRVVIRRDFPVEYMSFETDAVSLDFSSVLGGKLSLKQPTQAVAKVVLTEAGIDRSFGAELVTKRLHDLDLPELLEVSGGKPVSFKQVSIGLLSQNRLELRAIAESPDSESVPLHLITTIAIERRRRITFTDPQFETDGIPEALHDRSIALGKALVSLLGNMIDLDRFNLDGVVMRLNRLETEGKTLVFSGYAQIERFPKTP